MGVLVWLMRCVPHRHGDTSRDCSCKSDCLILLSLSACPIAEACQSCHLCWQALCDLGYSAMDIITTLFRVVRNYQTEEFLKLEFIRVGGPPFLYTRRSICMACDAHLIGMHHPHTTQFMPAAHSVKQIPCLPRFFRPCLAWSASPRASSSALMPVCCT